VDKATIGGVVVGLGGILGGMMMEGGKLAQIMQPTAAIIVGGGTLGAVMIAFPLEIVLAAAKRGMQVIMQPHHDAKETIKELVKFANQARKDGIVSLDAEIGKIKEPFLKKALMLAVDGTEPEELRSIMEVDLDQMASRDEKIPAVFEAVGGFAPTIGIIGAVLGLIQVMQHLNDINEVGRGIAVAFVATIYGVALANIVALPSAGKLKIRIHEEHLIHEMTLDGVISILEGMNPRMIETKLYGYIGEATPDKKDS